MLAATSLAVLASADHEQRRFGAEVPAGGPARFAIVLDGGTEHDAIPGYPSRMRARRGAGLLENQTAATLIISGGGSFGPEGRSGAQLMRDLVVAEGAPPDRILTEDRSTTTFENLRFTFAMLDKLGAAPDGSDTLLVTGSTHLLRARQLAGYLGRDEIRPVAVDVLGGLSRSRQVPMILREAGAWWYNLGKAAMWEVLGAAGIPASDRGTIVR